MFFVIVCLFVDYYVVSVVDVFMIVVIEDDWLFVFVFEVFV